MMLPTRPVCLKGFAGEYVSATRTRDKKESILPLREPKSDRRGLVKYIVAGIVANRWGYYGGLVRVKAQLSSF